MLFWQNFLLKQRITWMVAGLCFLALLIFETLFLSAQYWELKKQAQRSLTSLANSLAFNSASALIFDDEKSAEQTLASVHTTPEILSASVLTADGRLFARYENASEQHYADLEREQLSLKVPIISGRETLGHIELQASLHYVYQALYRVLWVTGGLGVLAMALVSWLALVSSRRLTEPLFHLAEIANEVGRTANYQLRAPVGSGHDEAAQLGRQFNAMLNQLEIRDGLLETHRDQLEQMIAVRTDALVKAKEAAESANRAKSVFLSNMSHELRTPLNAVIGFSHLMASAETLTPEQTQNLEIINRAGNHLLSLINSVLDLSKIESGQAQIIEEDTDLAQLLQDCVALLRPRAEAAGLTLHLSVGVLPATVRVDAMKLRQILINLLGNAIKFTEHGSVRLVISTQRLNEHELHYDFVVSDTGIGISPDDQRRIFEPFVQVFTHATSAGTGLGLTLARQFLQLMGSDLALESRPGAGSRFQFSLVLTGSAQCAATAMVNAPPVGLAPAEQGRKILIADDNADSRLLLQRLLERLSFVVMQAENGKQAVQLAASFGPDLIFMDWRMPELDGLEAVRQIRAHYSARQHPQQRAQPPRIIMFSASAFSEEQAATLRTGADGFLAKPLDETQLYAVLEQQLQLHFIRAGQDLSAPVRTTMTGDEAPLTVVQLSALRAEVLANLAAGVRSLNRVQLMTTMAQFADGEAALATRITQMLDAFQYRELATLLEQAQQVGPAQNLQG